MRVEGQATFNHDKATFGSLLLNAVVTPETEVEHAALTQMTAIPEVSVHMDAHGIFRISAIIREGAPIVDGDDTYTAAEPKPADESEPV